jgi:hypothetical protein
MYIFQCGLCFRLRLLVLLPATTRNPKTKYIEMSVSLVTTNDTKMVCPGGPRCDLNHRHL